MMTKADAGADVRRIVSGAFNSAASSHLHLLPDQACLSLCLIFSPPVIHFAGGFFYSQQPPTEVVFFMEQPMPQVQIKNRYTNAVLFECEVPDGIESGMHIRHALEKAIASNASLVGALLRNASLVGASLVGASLRNASLDYASLDGASLRNASLDCASLRNASLKDGSRLSGNRPFFSIGPIGSRSDVFQAFTTDRGLRLKAGCFFGTLDEFRAKLIATHATNKNRKEYEAALLLIEKHAALWPADKTNE